MAIPIEVGQYVKSLFSAVNPSMTAGRLYRVTRVDTELEGCQLSSPVVHFLGDDGSEYHAVLGCSVVPARRPALRNLC